MVVGWLLALAKVLRPKRYHSDCDIYSAKWSCCGALFVTRWTQSEVLQCALCYAMKAKRSYTFSLSAKTLDHCGTLDLINIFLKGDPR